MNPIANFRPTIAEIDLGAVRHNVGAVGGFIAPGVERLAVVKANAYGHGDIEVARACLDAGANRYWGLTFNEGSETSLFGKQVEDYACVYTSRVSNFLFYSPLQYFPYAQRLFAQGDATHAQPIRLFLQSTGLCQHGVGICGDCENVEIAERLDDPQRASR